MMESARDEELLQAAKRGDAQALEALVERHFGAVYAIAYARMRHRETAEDLAQEVFLRACLYLDQLQDTGRFAGWLSQIVHNLANDWLKRGQRVSRLVPMVSLEEVKQEIADPNGNDAQRLIGQKEEDETVRDAIFRLPEEQREIVLLHYVEGLSQRDIAGRLEMHPSKVNRQLKRALAAMKDSLEPALRDSAPTLRASRQTAMRTASLVGAAIALPAVSKAAIVTAAGGSGSAAGLSASGAGAASSAASAAKASSGFLKTITTHTATGGKLMAISKGIAIAVTGLSLVVGGMYAVNHHNGSRAEEEKAGAAGQIAQVSDAAPVAPAANPAQETATEQANAVPETAAGLNQRGAGGTGAAAVEQSGPKITPAQPKTDGEKEVLAILNNIKNDIKEENYQRLGTYGVNTMLSWRGAEGPKRIKDHVTVCLMDNMIDDVDYMAHGVPTKFTSIGDAAIDMQLSEHSMYPTALVASLSIRA